MTAGKNFICAAIKSSNRIYFNRVKEDMFYDKPQSGDSISEQEMLAFVKRHIAQFRTLPTPAVCKAADIPYVETDQPPEYYIEEIKKRAVYTAYAVFAKELSPHIRGNIDMNTVTDLINKFGEQIAHINASDRSKTLSEIGREIEHQIEIRKSGAQEVFVPFGWPTLDTLTGGMSGGDLAYLIARPGVGKSNLLSYCAHHAWKQGFSPMLLTMEMTDVQISRRLYGLEGAFNPDAVRRGIPDSEVEKRLASAIDRFEKGPPFHVICGQTRQTVDTITALVDELRPDVLYIDAAYLVSMNGNSQAKMWEKLAQVGERLKQLAISRDIPIVMTVQFNREAAKGKRYELDNIAGSDAIGQLGSVIVSIREGEAQYEGSRRILNIIKNREGGVDEFQIHNRFDPPDFSEVVGNAEPMNMSEEEIKL